MSVWRGACTHLCAVVGSACVEERVWPHLCIIVSSARVREGVWMCSLVKSSCAQRPQLDPEFFLDCSLPYSLCLSIVAGSQLNSVLMH